MSAAADKIRKLIAEAEGIAKRTNRGPLSHFETRIETLRECLAIVEREAASVREQALREAIAICMPTDRGLYDSEMRSYGDHFAGMIYALIDKPLPKPAPDADGWIPWGGGECPVDGNEVVEVRLREYDETPIAGADCFGWSHDGGYDDIIAYRIVKEPADGNG